MAVAGLVGTQAAFAGDSGWYVLGASGQTFGGSDKSSLANVLTSSGGIGFSSNLSRPTVYNLDLGYQLNKNIAFEGGYIGLNNETYTAFGGNLPTPVSLSVGISGWNAKVVGILPVADKFSLLGKVGVAEIKESINGTALGAVISTISSITDITYGVGAKYDFNENIAGRIDLDRYSVGSTSNNLQESVWTVGIAYKF